MPEVGDRSIFAIEWQETSRDEIPNVFGHFCYWVKGERIGDFVEETELTRTAENLRHFLSYAGERHISFLDGASKETVFAYVFELVMGPPQPDEMMYKAQQRFEQEHPANFRNIWAFLSRLTSLFHLHDLTPNVFDHLSIILIDDGSLGMQRLIWADWRHEGQLCEVRLPEHTFDEVATAFLATADLPARPTTVFDLFHQAGGGSIHLDGQTVYRRYQRQVRGWTEVHVRRVESAAAPVQGLRIRSGKVKLAWGGEQVQDMILWADEAPDLVRFQVIGQQGAVLKLWNVWRSEPSYVHSDYGNAGMLIEEDPSTLRLRCSDGIGTLDFHDLVVELTFHPGKPA